MSILFQRSFAAVATGFVMLAGAQSHADSLLPAPPGYAPYVPPQTHSPGLVFGRLPQTQLLPPRYAPYVPAQTGSLVFGRLPQTPNCLGCGSGLRLQQTGSPIGFGRLPQTQPLTPGYVRVHPCRPGDRIILGSAICTGP